MSNCHDYLPTFGGGHDCYISNDCNNNQDSYNSFHTYENTTGQQYLFTGTRNFKVDDIEVFVRM